MDETGHIGAGTGAGERPLDAALERLTRAVGRLEAAVERAEEFEGAAQYDLDVATEEISRLVAQVNESYTTRLIGTLQHHGKPEIRNLDI